MKYRRLTLRFMLAASTYILGIVLLSSWGIFDTGTVHSAGTLPDSSRYRSDKAPYTINEAASKPVRVDAAPVESSDIARGNTIFGVELFSRLRNRKGNLSFSPYSISRSLAMIYAGARGKTMEEIASVLHFPENGKGFHRSYSRLNSDILQAEGPAPHQKLAIADSFWAREGYEYQPQYIDLIKQTYRASLFEVNYSRNPENARERINAWVSEHTERKITEFLKQGMIRPDTELVIADVIYFNGLWSSRFDVKQTRAGVFHVGKAKQVSAELMNQAGRFRTADLSGIRMIELPYSDHGMSMIILLPADTDGLADLEKKISKKNLSLWLDKLLLAPPVEVDLTLPRFTVTDEFELSRVLSAMGMPRAFSSSADFSGMTKSKEAMVSAVVHKVRIEVDEQGTEAAAATGTVMTKGFRKPVKFSADHPFVYLIRHNSTGTVLFMGRIVNPNS